jgi:hypothetical protein
MDPGPGPKGRSWDDGPSSGFLHSLSRGNDETQRQRLFNAGILADRPPRSPPIRCRRSSAADVLPFASNSAPISATDRLESERNALA